MVREGTASINEVFLHTDGLVRIIYHGNQDTETMTNVVERATQLLGQKSGARMAGNVLSDIRDIGRHAPETRRIGLQARETMQFRKLAILISPSDPYTAKISQSMNSMSSRRKEVRYFKTEKGALRWLAKD
jgi:hypothetical protein